MLEDGRRKATGFPKRILFSAEVMRAVQIRMWLYGFGTGLAVAGIAWL